MILQKWVYVTADSLYYIQTEQILTRSNGLQAEKIYDSLHILYIESPTHRDNVITFDKTILHTTTY